MGHDKLYVFSVSDGIFVQNEHMRGDYALNECCSIVAAATAVVAVLAYTLWLSTNIATELKGGRTQNNA